MTSIVQIGDHEITLTANAATCIFLFLEIFSNQFMLFCFLVI